MVNKGAGKFSADWSPDTPHDAAHPASLSVTFHNTWLDLSARAPVAVEGFLDLVLHPTPNPIDLGAWEGERGAVERCGQIDLAGSTNAERVRLQCVVAGGPPGYSLLCGPVPGSEARLGSALGQPMQWQVCVRAPACCDAAASPGTVDTVVTLAGENAHYASGAVGIPVHFAVSQTGFLRCFWPLLAIGAAVVTFLWVAVGILRPHGFGPNAALRLASNEASLKRASAQMLREQPGGRRGFYRSARTCIDGAGNCVRSPRRPTVVVEAGPGGTTRFARADGLEKKDRSSGKWQKVEAGELALGYVPGVVYRSGTLHLKFE